MNETTKKLDETLYDALKHAKEILDAERVLSELHNEASIVQIEAALHDYEMAHPAPPVFERMGLTDARTPAQKPTLKSCLVHAQSIIEEVMSTSSDDIGPSLVEQMRICLELSDEALAASQPAPAKLTLLQQRVLEHYKFAQFDDINMAGVPEFARKDLRAMLDELDSTVQAKAVADMEGWKLVPVKPTREMVDAGDGVTYCDTASAVWSAMLAAAPTPSKGEA